MINYKGIFYEEDNHNTNNKRNFYEGGAHFKYMSLYKKLSELQRVLSPSRIIIEEPNENKIIKLKRKKFKNNTYVIKNYKQNSLDKLLESNKNVVIKKEILRNNDFCFNKIQSSINDNFNSMNNYIKKKNIENIKIKDNNCKEDNNYSKDNNTKKEPLIKLKLKKLENIRLYKGNYITKNIHIKNNNYSLPKIDSIYLKHLSGDNNENNKNNFSDITENTNNNHKRNNNLVYKIKNISLSSNNLDVLNNQKINKSIYKNKSKVNEQKNLNQESRNYILQVINKFNIENNINNNNSPMFDKIQNINSYNNYINKNIKESFNKIEKDKIFGEEMKNKKMINLYLNTFKKYEKSKYNYKSKNK